MNRGRGSIDISDGRRLLGYLISQLISGVAKKVHHTRN